MATITASAVLVISAVLVGIVALGTILSVVTMAGRRGWRRVVSRRPRLPHTRVHIEPHRTSSTWTPIELPTGERAAFAVRCVITNLTPSYDLQLMGVELRGIRLGRFRRLVSQVQYIGGQRVIGTVLPADTPVDLRLHLAFKQRLPPGTKKARIVLKDHLGNGYRSRRMSFAYHPPHPKQQRLPDGPENR